MGTWKEAVAARCHTWDATRVAVVRESSRTASEEVEGARLVGRFAGDPDFAIRWPREVLADELQRLIAIGQRVGIDSDWMQEVELLLDQAFSSSVPADDFRRLMSKRWNDDDEPF